MFSCCSSSSNLNGLHEDSQLLTYVGYKSIVDLEEDEAVWNGFEFDFIRIKALPKPVQMLTVEFSNYVKIKCIPSQVFPIVNYVGSCQYQLIEACNLEPGMILMYPEHMSFPCFSVEKFAKTYGDWIHLMMDEEGDIIKDNVESCIQLRLKFQSLGVDSNVHKVEDKFKLQFTQKGRQKLLRYGVDCQEGWTLQDLGPELVTVTSVSSNTDYNTVYTFAPTLHRSHMMVNGLMIGNNSSV